MQTDPFGFELEHMDEIEVKRLGKDYVAFIFGFGSRAPLEVRMTNQQAVIFSAELVNTLRPKVLGGGAA